MLKVGPRATLKTGWDARRETSLRAVSRLLWRKAHAEKSGHLATSIDQLIRGLAPVMGWPVKTDENGKWDIQAMSDSHSRAVRGWLDDLQACGALRWTGVRDNRNIWWRTEIELLTAPLPPADVMQAATRRVRGFAKAERRRRRLNPARRRDLGRVVDRSTPPSKAEQAHLARQRARALNKARRCSGRRRSPSSYVRANPFGAPPTSEQQQEGLTTETELSAAARAPERLGNVNRARYGRGSTEEIGTQTARRDNCSHGQRGSTRPERAASRHQPQWVRTCGADAAAGRPIDPRTGWIGLCDWPMGWEIPTALITSALAAHRSELFDTQNGQVPPAQERRLRRLLDALDRHGCHAPGRVLSSVIYECRRTPGLRLADVLDALSRKLDQAIEDQSRGFHIYW